MRYLLLLTLCLSSCGPSEEPWCVTDGLGWEVTGYRDQLTCDDLNRVDVVIARELTRLSDYDPRFRQTAQKLKGVRLHVQSELPYVDLYGGRWGGMAHCLDGSITIGNVQMLYQPLAHEMVHIVQSCWADITQPETRYSSGSPADWSHKGWDNVNPIIADANYAVCVELGGMQCARWW
jgi:hypothetical protein